MRSISSLRGKLNVLLHCVEDLFSSGNGGKEAQVRIHGFCRDALFEKFAYKLLRFRVQTHLEDVGDGQRLFYYFPVAAFVRANTADFS